MHFNRMKTLDFILVYFFISSISSAYTITPSQSIKDGQNLTSQSETFELGFFSPSSNSKNRYLGMWYKKIPGQTVVWVANRDSPLNDSSGVLMLSEEGNLVILNRTNHIIWSTNSSKAAKNPIVEFLESGNLVLRDGKADEYLWQSFDHPSDTLLPGMKRGWDLRIGLNRYLRSWKSFDDPSLGDFTVAFELTGDPESFIRKGSKKYYRFGPFNGIRNSGSPELKNNSLFIFNYVVNEEEVYYTFQLVNQSVPSRYVLKQNGNEGLFGLITWVDQTQSWVPRKPMPRDPCDTYGLCGTGSICDTNDIPYCRCLKGFKPRSPLDYNELDWSMGCEREMPLDCEEGNSFMKLSEVKVPDTMHTLMNTSTSISLEDCRIKCLKNCSCVAHANADIRGNGSGCVMWFGDLMDIRRVLGAGQDLYIRSSGLEAGLPKETRSGPERKKADERVIIIISVIFSVSLVGAVIYFIWRKKIMQILQKVISNKRRARDIFYHPGEKNDDLELNFFDMDTIVRATHNFSHMSMLGKGGFGCVYKGMLEDGQEIAVKRLSKNSGQGMEEFKNEVMLIARLQHRNLVRLLGLCMEGEEKILVYEYMENKSLDAILFDKAKNFILDWPKRFSIISGISRGLLYLHQDSRFRIIHRDLKASNVLLDGLLNPKISDFGMARIFGGDDTQGETKRVVGTYGYMSPEYVTNGIFSVKSDVFSFGVLVLEIISGKKNNGFFSSDNQLNLVGYAWRLWKEGHPLELIDETAKDSCPSNEALRCIHVGLLCVQEHAKDRPTMSSVVLMLSTDATKLQQPRQPGFCFDISPIEADSTSANQEPCSGNDVTVTILEASILLREGYKLNGMSEKEDISLLMRWKMFLN